MNKALIVFVLLAACKSEDKPAKAEEVAPQPARRCHIPVKQEDRGDKIVFITCDGNESYFIKPKDGKDGKNGTNGTNGRSGSNGRSCSITETNQGADITCGSETVKLKHGMNGKDGMNGQDGRDGMNGSNGGDTLLTICEHGQDHVDRTVRKTLKEYFSTRLGSKSQFDYAGRCVNENRCNCDQCTVYPQPDSLDSRFYFWHDDLIIRRGR